MNTDLKVARKWRQSEKRPASCVELEGMLKMLVIQDHMTELAIQLARLSDWAALPPEESQLQEQQFRRAMEEKNALFKNPKEQAVAEARRKLGIDDHGRIQSYEDKDENRSLKQISDFQRHVEKDLHRMTREALRQAKKIGEKAGGDDQSRRTAWERYETLKSTFEKVAAREFMSG